MPPRSPLEYDVSVAADKARRRRRPRRLSGAVEGVQRVCEHPSCDARAAYRAPRSPDRLHAHRWFCLEHVRAFNAAWNFFGDIDDAELEAAMDRARLWERPTWRFGRQPGGGGSRGGAERPNWAQAGFADPFEVLEADRPGAGAEPPRAAQARRAPPELRRALAELGADETATFEAARARYRALVKDLHPDMKGGDRGDEDRLARVLRAWEIVRGHPHFRR